MKTRNIKLALIMMVVLLSFGSCNNFSDNTTYVNSEFEKKFDGSWKITKALRNGIDITKLMDFSKFRINFNKDNTYTIENYLPFLVRKGGEWSIDDPQYPYHLIFREKDSTSELKSALDYSIVNGKREISLSFSPGHPNNIYTYTFEKISTDF